MSDASLTLSSGELMTLRRIANGGAVISLLRAADVARLKKAKLIKCGARQVHLTERGRAFLARLEADNQLVAPSPP